MVAKILTDRGEHVDIPGIQAWLKAQDPTEIFTKTNDDLANEYTQVDTGGSNVVGAPSSAGRTDLEREKKTMAQHMSDFDKYSTPKDKFK